MDSLEYAGEWQPATPEHRPVKRLDAYGFEVRWQSQCAGQGM